MEKKPMTELAPGKLARPMDRNAMSNDMGILRNLLGMINNPLITGAQPPSEETQTPSPPTSENMVKSDPPVKTDFKLPMGSRKILFTGAPRAGKSWLAAQVPQGRVMEFMDPVDAMIANVFPDAKPEETANLRQQIFSWGSGVVSQKFPLTASRMHFVASVRLMSNQQGTFGIHLEQFGTPDFWVNSLIARTNSFLEESPGYRALVTDIATPEQYTLLRSAGFRHIHVLCNNITRSGRGTNQVVSPLVASIDRDITQKISQQPRGPKLWAVWCDEKYPPTSSRLLTVDEFLNGIPV